MRTKFLAFFTFLVLLFIILLLIPQKQQETKKVLSSSQNSKSSQCQSINNLPDKNCTPGEIDPEVTQEDIYQTICKKGYTTTVRPPVSYTGPLKLVVMKKYGDSDSPKNYEFDHLISLELGGSPTSEKNLWPEPYNSSLGSYQKDRVENYLNKQVCSGSISLSQAQTEISTDWVKVYNSIQNQ